MRRRVPPKLTLLMLGLRSFFGTYWRADDNYVRLTGYLAAECGVIVC